MSIKGQPLGAVLRWMALRFLAELIPFVYFVIALTAAMLANTRIDSNDLLLAVPLGAVALWAALKGAMRVVEE